MNISEIPFLSLLHLTIYGLYLIVWHIFNVAKIIRRKITGTTHIPYKQARLGKIILKNQRDVEEITRKEDFITVDDGFITLNELKQPQWTVYTLDKRGVIFVELPKALSEYTIDKYPFVFIPVYNEALRIAEIDLNTFLSFSEELEVDYKPPRTLLFTNTARCASTLFGSMLQHDGYSHVIAEHHSLINLSIPYNECYWTAEEVERLLPAVVKFMRKCIPDDKLFVIKCASSEAKLVPFFKKVMPEVKHIFMFRKKGYESVERVVSRDPEQILLMKIYGVSPLISKLFGSIAVSEGRFHKELKPTTIKEHAMIVYGAPYYYYKKNIECFDFDIVWHHELINDTEKVLKPIYEKLDLPLDLLDDGKEKLKRDSQNETFLSQSALSHIKNTPMTPDIQREMKRYAEVFQMEAEVSGLYDN